MFSFLRKRRLRAISPLLAADLVPRAAHSKQWPKACRAELTPRAQVEGGLVELAIVERVLADAADPTTRATVLPQLAREFAREFAGLAAEAGLGAAALTGLAAQRREEYRRVLDGNPSGWHLRLAAQAYGVLAGPAGGTEVARPLAMLALVVATTTRELLRDAVK